MAEKCKGGVIYFAVSSENEIIQKHRAAGGRAVFIKRDLHELSSLMKALLMATALIAILTVLVAFIISSKLQQFISRPILKLAGTVKQVSAEKNFAIRAEEAGRDEVGLLIDGFNDMLGQIQQRDEQLRKHRDHLEEEVAARTSVRSRCCRCACRPKAVPRRGSCR